MLPALLRRTARTLARVPALAASPVLMCVFFLVIYSGQLGRAGGAMLPGGSYLAFVLPLVLLTTALSGAVIAGQLLARDMGSGYHDRLLLAGVGRARVIAAPLVATAAVLVLQAALVVAVGLGLGLRDVPAPGLAGLVVGTTLAGTAVALLPVATALWTRSAAAVNAVFSLVFSLSFLTSAFAPRADLSGWLRVVASANPLTYVLEGLRDVAGGVAPAGSLQAGAVVVAVLAAAGVVACAAAFRHAEAAR